MIDGFVLVTPLLLLPIALLFIFVGCTFDPSGTATDEPLLPGPSPHILVPATLKYDPGLGAVVASVEYLVFEILDLSLGTRYSSKDGKFLVDYNITSGVNPPITLTIDVPSDLLAGRATCSCFLVPVSPAPPVGQPPIAEKSYNRGEPVVFTLTGGATGRDFSLS